ncbi:MAG TPA: hypothetical protein VMQ54_00970 [Steroidobacteraceae bacterium]|jgi:hypothetical protein|nr:hypothetical protein [Steroidobacteraceae bacterium]
MVSGSGSSGTPLKDLSASRFSRLSELLDKSLEMPAEEREAWLAELDSSDPDAASQLRGLFASHGECRSEAFLEDRDLWIRQWASTLEAEPELVGKLFGPYRVLSLLGHGGMGSVWLAERVDSPRAPGALARAAH